MARIVDSSLFPEALTFDDVLLTPGHSEICPRRPMSAPA